jgi:hypothetical protein
MAVLTKDYEVFRDLAVSMFCTVADSTLKISYLNLGFDRSCRDAAASLKAFAIALGSGDFVTTDMRRSAETSSGLPVRKTTPIP